MKATEVQELEVAVGLVLDGRQRVLFISRDDPELPEYHQRWELPGGKIEPGEESWAAAAREVLEETGYLVVAERQLPWPYMAMLSTKEPPLRVNVSCWVCYVAGADNDPPEPAAKGSEPYHWALIEDLEYQRIIPGSREFVVWMAHTLGFIVPEEASLYSLELENVSPSQNMYRTYRIELRFVPGDPRGEFIVHAKRGRGGRYQTKSFYKHFKDFPSALSELMSRAEKRQKHGYKVAWRPDTHPLRSWLTKELDQAEHTEFPGVFSEPDGSEFPKLF